MSNTGKFRLVALLIGLAAVLAAYHKSTEEAMVDAANNFLNSLTVEQRSQVLFDFDKQDREIWHFVPDNNFAQVYKYPRQGLTYGHMQPEQRHLADALLSTGLSRAGFVKAKTVMSLEDVLRIKEADTTGRRDPYRYHFSIFGAPSNDGRWAWRVEGHHISLHFTLQGGELVSTSPTFFGANPHEVDITPRKGLTTLAAEERLARKLMRSFSEAQRGKALVAGKAYKDILTHAQTRAELEKQPPGLSADQMSPEQYRNLMELIEEYADNLPAEVAAARMKVARETPKNKLFFAWAGAVEPDIGDYYRVQAPKFLIEYDNTQNHSNHSHTVWRDFENDFGRDVLAWHHRFFDHGLGVAAD